MQDKLLNYCNLSVFSDPVIEFIFDKNCVNGFITKSGKKIKTLKLILTTGTFLNGLIHIGEQRTPAGRFNEKYRDRTLREMGIVFDNILLVK